MNVEHLFELCRGRVPGSSRLWQIRDFRLVKCKDSTSPIVGHVLTVVQPHRSDPIRFETLLFPCNRTGEVFVSHEHARRDGDDHDALVEEHSEPRDIGIERVLLPVQVWRVGNAFMRSEMRNSEIAVAWCKGDGAVDGEVIHNVPLDHIDIASYDEHATATQEASSNPTQA